MTRFIKNNFQQTIVGRKTSNGCSMTKKASAWGSFSALVVLTLAGCASAPQRNSIEFACENGKGFSVIEFQNVSVVEVDRMKFDVKRENLAGGETLYTCNMLNVRRTGETARLEMDGKPYLNQCRMVQR